ncbi:MULTISPECIES: rod shape-determining protein RodA [Marinobacter]|uniref:Peptidoglycan glycosyltransferase MrdB n=1 Tax=Marinobacter xestospongiae TaxID=994319 RepID=A0ABU3VT77_9GAMM|nr:MULTISPECIES: rod shape-determining protein RodA [Marinobacter]MCG8518983.1 rod shape-determining protein RodA [Pseudomonadales bacterium]MDV2077471.1 rod shape-determining protein RodA [Marinobacter xestospongiae]UDL04297.1 rod shape-determining protein RodA [Marinobacter sp. CA1]
MTGSQLFSQRANGGLGSRRGLWSILHLDPILLLLLLVLVAGGMVVLYSGADRNFAVVEAQAVRMGVALVVMLVFAQLDPSVYRRWAPWLYLVGLGALVAVLAVGVGAKGAQRWLALPGLPRFQPSELMKLVVPMMAAWYLSRHFLPPRLSQVAIALAIVLLPMGLIVQQPDLGTALLVGAAGLFVVFFAGISWKLITAFLGMVSVAAPLMWFFVMRDYQKQRVLTLLDPQSDPLGAGWNIIQSKTAIGSGGWSGKGWLQGTQSHLEFLPESHTDFIVAVLAEEFGFIGMLVLLSVYLLIMLRCLYIAVNAQDSFGRLLAGALTMTFFIYIFVNIGMVSGLLPVVGVPLPLISYGGTSSVTLMAAFGVLMSIHTHRRMITA